MIAGAESGRTVSLPCWCGLMLFRQGEYSDGLYIVRNGQATLLLTDDNWIEVSYFNVGAGYGFTSAAFCVAASFLSHVMAPVWLVWTTRKCPYRAKTFDLKAPIIQTPWGTHGQYPLRLEEIDSHGDCKIGHDADPPSTRDSDRLRATPAQREDHSESQGDRGGEHTSQKQ
jgi:hypothetical protein